MAKKHSTPYENYYPVFYWMSKLSVVQLDKEGVVKTDGQGKPVYSKLSGVAKDLYAIIYRFSCGRNGCCTMSYDYFMSVTGASKSAVIRNLELLERSELIEIQTIEVPAAKDNAKADNILGKRYRTRADTLEILGLDLGLSLAEDLRKNESKAIGWNDYIKDTEQEDNEDWMQQYLKRHKKK